MAHVVDALGAGKGSEVDQVCLAMLDVATKVGSAEAVSLATHTIRSAPLCP